MLFPRNCVHKEFGATKRTSIHIGELKAVNKFYGISFQAALFRAVDLNIMPYHQLRKYYMTIFNKNREEDGLSQYKAEEKSHRLEQLVARAESLGLIDSNKAAEILNISPETLSRMLRVFKNDGLIDSKAKTVDKEKLQTLFM